MKWVQTSKYLEGDDDPDGDEWSLWLMMSDY